MGSFVIGDVCKAFQIVLTFPDGISTVVDFRTNAGLSTNILNFFVVFRTFLNVIVSGHPNLTVNGPLVGGFKALPIKGYLRNI